MESASGVGTVLLSTSEVRLLGTKEGANMRRYIFSSAVVAALTAAGTLSAQVGVTGPGGGSAQAGPGGASATAPGGGASAQSAPGGASAQAGSAQGSAQAGPAGASAQSGNAAAGTQATPNASAQIPGQASGNLDANLNANAQGQGSAGLGSTDGSLSGDASSRAALGVTFDSADDAMVVTNVEANSPAAQAGLQAGDRIISFNGREFDSRQEFITAVQGSQLDSQAQLVIERNGQRQNLDVRMGSWNRVYPSTAWNQGGFYGQSQPYHAMRPAFDDPAAAGAYPQGHIYGGTFNNCCAVTTCCPTYGYAYGGFGGRRRGRGCW